ncbi:FAD/NAD(P)-binding protein [Pendulispora brunnea]|uniref:FAD/NAD(P)-binding protein n=1 Tax=Pendulispora brunnea TaxID=2905690 RepID=A0ABZ2K8G2_9BACT
MGALKYCIVGTGFAGTCALWHLVQRLTAPHQSSSPETSAITIITVERGTVNGPGYPYSKDNVQLAHRCNNQASTMSIHGNDFIDWMTENKSRLIRDHAELVLETHPGITLADWQPDNDEFYPRALFGLYLEQRFQEALERALAHGIHVHQYMRHEAIDGRTEGETFSLTLRQLDTHEEFTIGGLDRVLLSTGHWQTKAADAVAKSDGFMASPYPPGAVKSAVANKVRSQPGRTEPPRVFVQGMGPSGIDAILTLCDEGEFTYTHDGHVASYRAAAFPGAGGPLHIVAGSRCGFFSPIRGPLATYEMHHLTEERLAAMRREQNGYLKIDAILELLDLELRRATGGAVGWADVVSPRYPSAREKLAVDLRDSYTGNLVYTVVLKARRMRFYSVLEPRDKAVYDRMLDTHFIRTAVPMPAANAEKLLALMDAGVLSVVKLGYDAPAPVVDADGAFRIACQSDDGQPITIRADCMIRASAQDFAMNLHPSPLMQNLLRRGEVVPHEEGGYVTGGIALAPGGYRVMKRAGSVCIPSAHLASFGSPVRFWQNERNFAGAFVEAAEWVADEWLEVAVVMSAADKPKPAAGRGPSIVTVEMRR